MTIDQKIDYLFSKINWKDSTLDAKAISIMNNLSSDIKMNLTIAKKAQAKLHYSVIVKLEESDAYENNVPLSDLFENEILNPIEFLKEPI